MIKIDNLKPKSERTNYGAVATDRSTRERIATAHLNKKPKSNKSRWSILIILKKAFLGGKSARIEGFILITYLNFLQSIFELLGIWYLYRQLLYEA